MPLLPGTKAILVDIEGTTTPIAFVHETLFPFAEARLEQCCARAGSSPGIADGFSLPAAEVLYLSDVVVELDAAGEAGMQTGLVDRPGNHPQPPSDHPVYRDFQPLI